MTVIESTPMIIEDPTLDDGSTDEPKLAHIIAKSQWEKGYMFGQKVRALCGYEWVPTRDPENYPVCQRCVAERERVFAGREGNN